MGAAVDASPELEGCAVAGDAKTGSEQVPLAEGAAGNPRERYSEGGNADAGSERISAALLLAYEFPVGHFPASDGCIGRSVEGHVGVGQLAAWGGRAEEVAWHAGD